MFTSPESGIFDSAALVMLHSDAGPMVDGVAQADVSGLSHKDDFPLARSLGDWRDARQASKCVAISPSQSFGGLSDLFARPTWSNVLVLLAGVVLAPGRRTATSALRILGRDRDPCFCTFHRILSRAAWSSRAVAGRLLILLIRAFVPSGAPVVTGIDDTIERRWGTQISARGIYCDPVRSPNHHRTSVHRETRKQSAATGLWQGSKETAHSGTRWRAGLAALAIAEYFRDAAHENVLFLIDNVYRLVQAGGEVSGLLNRLPSRVGSQPTLASEIAELEERIASVASAAITSIQAVYVPADDFTDPVVAEIFRPV